MTEPSMPDCLLRVVLGSAWVGLVVSILFVEEVIQAACSLSGGY